MVLMSDSHKLQQGLYQCWDNTAPRPFSEASVSKMNCLVKLGYPNTGAVVKSIFRASKATRCSEFQIKVDFVNSGLSNMVTSFFTSFLTFTFLTFV